MFGLWIFPLVTLIGLGMLIAGACIIGVHVPHPYVVLGMIVVSLVFVLWYLVDSGLIEV